MGLSDVTVVGPAPERGPTQRSRDGTRSTSWGPVAVVNRLDRDGDAVSGALARPERQGADLMAIHKYGETTLGPERLTHMELARMFDITHTASPKVAFARPGHARSCADDPAEGEHLKDLVGAADAERPPPHGEGLEVGRVAQPAIR